MDAINTCGFGAQHKEDYPRFEGFRHAEISWSANPHADLTGPARRSVIRRISTTSMMSLRSGRHRTCDRPRGPPAPPRTGATGTEDGGMGGNGKRRVEAPPSMQERPVMLPWRLPSVFSKIGLEGVVPSSMGRMAKPRSTVSMLTMGIYALSPSRPVEGILSDSPGRCDRSSARTVVHDAHARMRAHTRQRSVIDAPA